MLQNKKKQGTFFVVWELGKLLHIDLFFNNKVEYTYISLEYKQK